MTAVAPSEPERPPLPSSPPSALLAGYADADPGVVDEAVTATGVVRAEYEPVLEVLQAVGPQGLDEWGRRLATTRRREGVVFTAWVDGRLEEQPFPLDPVPRLLPPEQWRHIATGVEQRTRALNAFLDDVYGELCIVRDRRVPDWVVTRSPGYRPQARGLTPGGQPRVVVSGLDLLLRPDGRWVVLEDNLRVPSGLGYALANRRTAAAAQPQLYDRPPGEVASPEDVARRLKDALLAAVPPGCARAAPSVVLLSDGPANSAWFEHRLLAGEMGVPVVQPRDLHPMADGSLQARVGRHRIPVDVAYRRLDEDDLPAHTTADGTPLQDALLTAARRGLLAIANMPGNGVADDKATYAYVPEMIRYYLAEEPVLDTVHTWILADAEQYAQVRGRLGDLVVKPVDGYGGQGVTFGPALSDVEADALERDVAAAPHRFVAQETVRFTSHPTVVDHRLAPRHVDLRVFAFAGKRTTAATAPLTRVALREGSLLVNSSQGGGSKDTWIMR